MDSVSSDGPERAKLMEAVETALRVASGQSVIHSNTIAERAKINPTDMECLDILAMVGPVPAGRLAEITGLTTGAITGIVDRLEARGYARREKDPSDRRRVIIRPVIGRAMEDFGHLFAPLQQSMLTLYERYSDEELALILDFLDHSNVLILEQIARLRDELEVEEAGPSISATPPND